MQMLMDYFRLIALFFFPRRSAVNNSISRKYHHISFQFSVNKVSTYSLQHAVSIVVLRVTQIADNVTRKSMAWPGGHINE